MAEKHGDPRAAEIRTIVTYSLVGVASSVVAVVLASPAGLGGVVGTSIASSFGSNAATAAEENVYARLPPFPAPVSQTELNNIRASLAVTAAAIDTAQVATDDQIERVRSIAASDGALAPPQEQGPIEVTPSQAADSFLVPSRAVLEPEAADANLELAALLLAHENV